jgi:hypothetical protein
MLHQNVKAQGFRVLNEDEIGAVCGGFGDNILVTAPSSNSNSSALFWAASTNPFNPYYMGGDYEREQESLQAMEAMQHDRELARGDQYAQLNSDKVQSDFQSNPAFPISTQQLMNIDLSKIRITDALGRVFDLGNVPKVGDIIVNAYSCGGYSFVLGGGVCVTGSGSLYAQAGIANPGPYVVFGNSTTGDLSGFSRNYSAGIAYDFVSKDFSVSNPGVSWMYTVEVPVKITDLRASPNDLKYGPNFYDTHDSGGGNRYDYYPSTKEYETLQSYWGS